jgi:hypothetical protein
MKTFIMLLGLLALIFSEEMAVALDNNELSRIASQLEKEEKENAEQLEKVRQISAETIRAAEIKLQETDEFFDAENDKIEKEEIEYKKRNPRAANYFISATPIEWLSEEQKNRKQRAIILNQKRNEIKNKISENIHNALRAVNEKANKINREQFEKLKLLYAETIRVAQIKLKENQEGFEAEKAKALKEEENIQKRQRRIHLAERNKEEIERKINGIVSNAKYTLETEKYKIEHPPLITKMQIVSPEGCIAASVAPRGQSLTGTGKEKEMPYVCPPKGKPEDYRIVHPQSY